ncbi:homoserine O-acetyltransferase MetX [Acidipropionibacterium jensenii]|uniref:Homoserine O-succinyltransferase n=2 Tax=Acidipropionibacterium jensenii TaxID=1749 RepID=A0A3S4YVH3_9ACTN|nr:homoserine O-acetyltransferase [Acidipropionibacterium jensenii]MDN5976252.1 homoserine O-acetyltransferase [Acidipropionibacterium jensenii]MDN5996139.1 homoserine O-acetyltransferase [Acidipropionibacterium jensenii]MDN6427303.1 homoserine O-acetyltransferase [Acidipropionibacterium jensenii]MDN6441888.1 homoserine O-acetyltransferase [Acidipropionibacterium jensenii]MDN6480093.1 homoserine O-acetyltransferase [Acidipropionibacterium jensenii]
MPRQPALRTQPVGPGVGPVRTRVATVATPDNPLDLVAGGRLDHVEVAYQTYGTLSPQRDNAIYICHALTGDAHGAGLDEDSKPGWWDNIIGPGRAIDTDRWFVVCSNLLGGCSGTTGPTSINPDTGQVWGLDFPQIDMHDFVEVHLRLAAQLGISRFHAVVGGSMGGMQALDWSLTRPDTLDNAVIIAASSRLTAQNIAFSAVGREAIVRDPDFEDGAYLNADSRPDTGLSIARMLAHITYLSEDAFAEKFGRTHQFGQSRRGFGVDFAVESYLDHQGETFLSRFDPLSYIYLTRVMDYFDPFGHPQATNRVVADPVNYLVVCFDTDWRFSPSHSRRIVRHLEGAGLPVTFATIASSWGHDSFLMKLDPYHDLVRAFLEVPAERRTARASARAPHFDGHICDREVSR